MRPKLGRIRLSKKSSLCWAFSIIYAIIIMGDEKCWNVEKWNEEYTKLWTPRAWCLRSICCAKSMQQSTGISFMTWWSHCTVRITAVPVSTRLYCSKWSSFSICMVCPLCAGQRKKYGQTSITAGFWATDCKKRRRISPQSVIISSIGSPLRL